MSFDTERQAIESRFNTAWAGATPVAFDNVTFRPPDTDAYVELSILKGRGEQISLGEHPYDRFVGVIQVTVKTIAGKGTSEALKLADLVGPIFKRARFSGILCRVPYLSPARIDEDGRLRIDVSIPYHRDEQN